MEGDISNKTIVVLVVLTVIISVLSTMVVLNEVLNYKVDNQYYSVHQSKNSAEVRMEVLPHPQPTTSISTGKVVFEIKKK